MTDTIKLLLVDDEPIILQGISNMVDWEAIGVELIDTCTNAYDALDVMMDKTPDILMTDIRMPQMDGLDLIKQTCILHPTIHCIILSGYDDFSYAKQAIKLGVKEYILKPCAKEELDETIRKQASEIREYRQNLLNSYESRKARASVLMHALLDLRPPVNQSQITEDQIAEVTKRTSDPGLLREAFCMLMLNHAPGFLQTQWIISSMQIKDEQLNSLVAQGLTCLYAESQEHDFIAKMTEYIYSHYDNPELSLQYLADHVVYMNADYIGKEFIREKGMKFSDFLTDVRMNHAKMLFYGGTSLHTYEVAEKVGLGHNPHYFSVLFKKHTGKTPKQYREEFTKKT